MGLKLMNGRIMHGRTGVFKGFDNDMSLPL